MIGNGLLPNALSAKGRQAGVDIGAMPMIGAATASDDAIGNNSHVDVRRAFATFGEPTMGPTLRNNSNATAGLYFGMTRSLTLTAELSRTQSKDVEGYTATLKGIAPGASLFF